MSMDERLAWLENAIAETTRWCDKTEGEARMERSFALPSSDDWDCVYTTDEILSVKQARETVARLEKERDSILAGHQLRKAQFRPEEGDQTSDTPSP
jgi:hypothetical protein